jgi:hypothetical protein
MDWLEAAFGFGDAAEPVPTPAKPRPAPKVQACAVVVAHPAHEGDLGEVIDCYYFVDDGTVVLCLPSGKATGEEQKLKLGDDPCAVAKRLRHRAWRQERSSERVPGFGRRLNYGPLGQA